MPSGQALIQEPNRAIESYIGKRTTKFPREESDMDVAQWWIIDIILPAILLIVLVWLVMRRRSTGKTGRTEQATRDLYREEETRRREGTDDL
jgi:hypothetical protein